MRKRFSRMILASIGAGLCVVGVARAQPVGDDRDAMVAFKEALEAGAAWTPPEGWVYRWRQELFPHTITREVERRERALRDTPDHPNRAVLGEMREQAERGPQITDFEVWWSGSDLFRLNTDYGPSVPTAYVDNVVSGDTVYSLTPASLSVVDRASPPEGMAYADTSQAEILRSLRELFAGGLGAFRYRELAPIRAEFEGSGLVGVLGSPDGSSSSRRWCTIQLEPGGAGVVPVVRMAVMRVEGEGGSTESRVRYGDWIESEIGRQAVASSVEFVNDRGEVDVRLTWLGARRMEPGEIGRATRTPTIDSTDAVRGPVTFNRIMDYRSGVIRTADPTSRAVSTIPMPGMPQSSAAPRWITVAGWASAAALVAGLCGVRLWRWRAAKRRLTTGGGT